MAALHHAARADYTVISIGPTTAERSEDTSAGVDTAPFLFFLYRYCSSPVSSTPFSSPVFISPFNAARRFVDVLPGTVPIKKSQPVAKVGGDHAHLVPGFSRVGGDASHGTIGWLRLSSLVLRFRTRHLTISVTGAGSRGYCGDLV